MSQNTYWHLPPCWYRLFISTDQNERQRLKRRGWRKITRAQAVDLCGGGISGERHLKDLLAVCGSGEVDPRRGVQMCYGHGASHAANA